MLASYNHGVLVSLQGAPREESAVGSTAIRGFTPSPGHPHRAGMGAAYGTAKSGVGIASMGVMRPELVMKSIVPVVMAGVLGIYGLIIAVIISTGGEPLHARAALLLPGMR